MQTPLRRPLTKYKTMTETTFQQVGTYGTDQILFGVLESVQLSTVRTWLILYRTVDYDGNYNY